MSRPRNNGTPWSVKNLKRRFFFSNHAVEECCHPKEGSMAESLSSAQFTVSETATVRASFSSTRSTLTDKKCSTYDDNRHPTAQRRVHFANSPKGDGGVLTDVRIFISNHGEDWSLPEMTHAAGGPICHFTIYQEDAMNAIAEDDCRTLLDTMDRMYFGTAFNPADKDSEEKRIQAMACWAKIQGGKYRGLEATLMKRAHKRRIGHRKNILQRQQTLRSQEPASTLEAQLRHISRKYSRASSEFAMFLAVGDSIVVHGHERVLSNQPSDDTAVTRAEL